MSMVNSEPIPVRVQCLNCKSEGGDFWAITPDLPYTEFNLHGKNPTNEKAKTLITSATCPLCDKVHTMYWDIPRNSG